MGTFRVLTCSPSVSQLKRASSEDTLTKPGAAAAPGVSRLKKTITTGAISELAESRLKPSTGRHKASVTRAASATRFAKVPAARPCHSCCGSHRHCICTPRAGEMKRKGRGWMVLAAWAAPVARWWRRWPVPVPTAGPGRVDPAPLLRAGQQCRTRCLKFSPFINSIPSSLSTERAELFARCSRDTAEV